MADRFHRFGGYGDPAARQGRRISDGRYTSQICDQVDASQWERLHITNKPPAAWLAIHGKVSGSAMIPDLSASYSSTPWSGRIMSSCLSNAIRWMHPGVISPPRQRVLSAFRMTGSAEKTVFPKDAGSAGRYARQARMPCLSVTRPLLPGS